MADNGRRCDDALALELAAGATVRDAAKSAGVSERTAHRRWADPAFRRRVTSVRAEAVSRAVGRLAAGMGEAADALRGLVTSESEAVRLSACKAILQLGVELRASVEFDERIAALEAAAPATEGG